MWKAFQPKTTCYDTIFELATLEGGKDESEWCGPYNSLLNHVFPVEEDYVVVPQYQRPEQLKSVNFTTIFIVRRERHPVLFLKVKAASHIRNISSREAADQQMRNRFKAMFDDVKIARLYGIRLSEARYVCIRWIGIPEILCQRTCLLVVFELRIRLLKNGGAWILLRRKVMVVFKKLLLR